MKTFGPVFANFNLVLFGLLCVAVWCDQRTRRIPNQLVVVGLICAVCLNTYAFGIDGLKQSLFGALVGLAILIPFFAMRLLGAGDVKLMAAVGAFLGPAGALLAVLFTMMAGGLLAVIVLLIHGRLKSTLNGMKNPERIMQAPKSTTRLPYSWAILFGTIGSVYSKV